MIEKAERIVCFTGAGISAESGIPTFRGTEGIWTKYPPALYGNIPGLAFAFLLRPGRVRDFAADAVKTIVDAKPNPGHMALAELEQKGRIAAVVTQNIDGLHEEAGSRTVHNVHGSLYVFRCRKCKERTKVAKDWLREVEQKLRSSKKSRLKLIKILKNAAPRCARCNGLQRPDIVFFGESLPADVMGLAVKAAMSCDAMLVVGTSGLVYPAADIPLLAIQKKIPVIEINPVPSALTNYVSIRLSGTASEIMPLLAREMLAGG